MNIIPLSTTTVFWKDYLVAAKQALGYSITSQLDAENIKIGSLDSFIISLGNLINPDSKPREVLTHPGSLLQHAAFSFLCVLDTLLIMEIMESSELSIISQPIHGHNRIVVITGNLEQWRTAIINGCSTVATYEFRFFCNKCMDLMDCQLWIDYRRELHRDKTILLIEK